MTKRRWLKSRRTPGSSAGGRQPSCCWLQTANVLLLLAFVVQPLHAELVQMGIFLQPESNRSFALTELFLRGPGVIDLSDVRVGIEGWSRDDATSSSSSSSSSSSYVDFAVVRVPRSFRLPRQPFLLHGSRIAYMRSLSVGPSDLDLGFWCCTSENFGRSDSCSETRNFGRLFLQEELYAGGNRSFVEKTPLKNGVFEFDGSGRYLFIMGMCNSKAIKVIIQGFVQVKSWYVFFPAENVVMLFLCNILTAVYIIMFVLYRRAMRANRANGIPAEKVIMCATIAAVLESVLNSVFSLVWNGTAHRPQFLVGWSMLAGGVKQGCILVLILLLSSGQRPSRRFILFGAAYIFASTALASKPILLNYFYRQAQLSAMHALQVLMCVMVLVNVLIALRVLVWLNRTIEHLYDTRHCEKLNRYRRFRWIVLYLLLSTTVASAISLWSFVPLVSDRIVIPRDREWIQPAVWYMNNCVALVGVAMLWWPSPRSLEYECVVELQPLHDPNEVDDATATDIHRTQTLTQRRRQHSQEDGALDGSSSPLPDVI